MAKMGDIFGETLRDFERAVQAAENRFTHHPAASAATATGAPTITADTQEDPMNVLAELEADAKALAAKFDTVDKDALTKLEDIQAHPAALDAFNSIADLVHSPVDATEGLSVVTSVLKMTLSAMNAQAQAAANVPADVQYAAGPTVAGQA